ncbi:alanine racemase [Actinorugispora endophytica]|uniref:Alanine racemase n=1 Tax=Actinorugispora endophytica TaxID=1605990 RepID=A0A4R6V8G0_9ACTN|nr:alanine racemase [Actinorugispora endophytica]TDQ55429.1 alanine racemase [Actinorugispora endophytica]
MPQTDKGDPTAPAPSIQSAPALAEAVIDMNAIVHNTRFMAEQTKAEIMAVVKADGFGHGIVETARATLSAGATWLGVTSCTEALRLRDAGVRAPVLSWMSVPDQDFTRAVGADVDIAVSAAEHLDAVADAARAVGATASVHLKVDTGLARNGSAPHLWPALVDRARALERDGAVRVRGVWSHLASADIPGDPTTGEQIALFDQAVAQARAAGLDPSLLHLANSAGILDVPESHYDLVRAGVGLYGVEPVAGKRFGLRPAMTLRARAIMVREVPVGTRVAYNHTYTTPRDGFLVLVPLGYADGVPRSAGPRGEVWIRGARRPVAGRIAMDQFVADMGGTEAHIGDEVVVFGPGDDGEPTVADWARWAGTIPHEILTGIGARVARTYSARPSSRPGHKELLSV